MSAQTAPSAWVPQPLAADSFASRLRLLRLASDDASVQEIAKRCGVPTPTWRKWEHGALPHNMAGVVRQLHDATGVDMAWLMWGATPPGLGLPQSLYVGGDNVIKLFPDVEPCDMQIASGQ
jgi:transcriptional regulator with XRE-family HTH domain